MKVLRLGTSADAYPGILEEQRAPALIAGMFQQATGEPLETVRRGLYPSTVSPALLAERLDEVQPEAVFMWVNTFWYAYESAPVRLTRGRGPIGRLAGRAAMRVSKEEWARRNPGFHLARRVAQRTLGTAYHYEPAEVLAAVEAWLHVILQRETVVPVVFSPPFCFMYEPDRGRTARAEARRRVVNAGLAELCQRLHVICDAAATGTDLPIGREYVEPDLLHPSVAGHRWFAERQAALHISAWRELRGEAALASFQALNA